jgi:hypothetical protein
MKFIVSGHVIAESFEDVKYIRNFLDVNGYEYTIDIYGLDELTGFHLIAKSGWSPKNGQDGDKS